MSLLEFLWAPPPGWALLPWILIVLGILAERYYRTVAPERRARERHDFDLQRERLKLMEEGLEADQRELEQLLLVLSRDPQPSETNLQELEETGQPSNSAIADYLKRRGEARSELPKLLERTTRLRADIVKLRKRLVATSESADEQIADLENRLDEVTGAARSILRRLLEGPRVFVQAEEPDSPAYGDLWIDTTSRS